MKTHRLFFALWPPAQVRHSIVETFSQLPPPVKGRFMQAHNLHVTLHFIGSVTEDKKDCLHVAAQGLDEQGGVKGFDIELNCYGHFSKVKILWMGVQNLPAELMQLQKNLGIALSGCGYQCDKRLYNPHVTLMRKCTKPIVVQQTFSIPWRVDEFVLVESTQDDSGVNYRVIEKYPLSKT
ncbi:RNA 2',3'-cyclic phosphodiesterase [Cardiobacterium sp. AH-315-I02]|nr:RNA 2',3'-cyclic phosphodiesterase [Cardiobacterium sp. AH-315-I02]